MFLVTLEDEGFMNESTLQIDSSLRRAQQGSVWLQLFFITHR